MIELIRSGDPVFLGWLQTRLAEAGIACIVLDAHTSSLYGGAVQAVIPRLMVADADAARARRLMAETECRIEGADGIDT